MKKSKSKNLPQITGMMHVNINCSDFDRSRAFYEMLGYKVIMKVEKKETEEIAKAVGMPHYEVRGALMALKDGSVIDLLEWKDPKESTKPYSSLYNLGLGRIALMTRDLDADVAHLKAQGVEFLSDPVTVSGPMGTSSRFVCFKDPDGTILELLETGPVMTALTKLSRLAGKKEKPEPGEIDLLLPN